MAHRRSATDSQEQREHLRMMSELASMFDEMLSDKKLVFPLEPEWERRLQRAYEVSNEHSCSLAVRYCHILQLKAECISEDTQIEGKSF
jgi:hypothetical protein